MIKTTTLLALLFVSVSSFAQLVPFDYSHDGIEREGLIYLPENIAPGAPLVFLLHGYTGTAQAVSNNYGMNAVADANGFAVVYPQGSKDAGGINFWNTNNPGEDVDDVGFLSNLALDLQTLYGFDENCTYVCGMSNGGTMSYFLGCERPDVFKAFASVTGTLTSTILSSCDGNITVPFVQIHGTDDIIVPFDGTTLGGIEFYAVDEVFRNWQRINNCGSDLYIEFPEAPVNDFSSVIAREVRDCDGGLRARFYRVAGGGHTWPGSPPIPFIDFLQPTNQDINASAEIWGFFNGLCSDSDMELGQGSVSEEGALLFPNPSFGEVNIELTGIELTAITIISVEGRIVYQGQLNEGRNYLSLRDLDKGFYVARISGSEEHVIKFVLE